MIRPRVLCLLMGAMIAGVASAAGQAHDHHEGGGGAADTPLRASFGAMAIPLLTHASPAMRGEDATELYLTQPMVMGHLALPGERVRLDGTLNLEGLTLRGGELNAGVWGEGFYDRRHPHTYLHEAMLSGWLLRTERSALSLAFGRGFAPFGTDDPMVRGLVKYPANHHLAQILERLTLIAALRHGPLTLEGSIFNGDEPTGPADLPSLDRFGDSWSARVTARPRESTEAQVSYAYVLSPEHAPGSGLDHRKWSASARYEGAGNRNGLPYVLVEWARTTEHSAGRPYHAFDSWLAEGSRRVGPARLVARLERTDRPEEERLTDPFRTPPEHMDVHVLGVTRWHIVSAAAVLETLPAGRLRMRPFVEVSRAAVRELHGSLVFDVGDLYGADRLWSLSIGSRLEIGSVHARMGRYGAALPRHLGHPH